MVKVNDRDLRHKDACHCDRKGGLLPLDELKSNIRIDLLSEKGWQLRRFSSKLSWRLCSDSECQHSLLLCLEYQSTGWSAEMPPPNLARQNEHRRTFPTLSPSRSLSLSIRSYHCYIFYIYFCSIRTAICEWNWSLNGQQD